MKTVFAILSLNIMLFACSGDNNEHSQPVEQPSSAPPAVSTTPSPKPVPDSTSVEINESGVKVTNKSGKSGTDVKINGDSSHVIIKSK